jgi:hypothetical protein
VGDPRLAPAGVIPPLPGGGGGNTPAASGAGSPLPGVRGPGARSFSAPQEFAPAASNASAARLLVRRFVAYRVTNFDDIVKLVAVLLHRVAMSSRGSVYYLNGRRMRVLLGLDAPIHPIDLSVVYEVLSRLGFDVVRQSRGKAAIINMGHPLIKEIRNAENVNDVIQVIRKHLGE